MSTPADLQRLPSSLPRPPGELDALERLAAAHRLAALFSRQQHAFAFGITAVIAIVVWLWQSDNPPHADSAEIADGVFPPVGGHGGPSHAFWAMIILLLVDVSVFASLVFAHVHVSMAAEICPPPGAALPDWRWPLASAALLVAGSAAMTVAQLAMGKHRR